MEDLKFELALLNAALKKLDADWDFTDIIRPLLSDQEPAIAVDPKLKRQIDRMTKLRDAFLQQKQDEKMPDKPAGKMPDEPAGSLRHRRRQAASGEETQPAAFQRTDQGRPPAAQEQTVGGSIPNPQRRRGPRAAQSDAVVVSEVLPAWGPLPRFEQGMDRSTYEHSVDCAFAHMRAHSDGPPQCKLRCIKDGAVGKNFHSLFSNRRLQFENVRAAAIANNFALIQVGYFRNENLVADRIVSDKDMKSFIAWAVDLLRSRCA